MRYDWVSFSTDYGTSDGFVAACHGVIARIAPSVRLIDVTHDVPPQDVRRGAELLAQTVEYLPDSVHLAVVDPGVGTTRRGVAIESAGGLLVGPDNGLLLPAADALGGVRAAVELTAQRYRLPATSATFHGRDIFAPAAAHLAAGVDPDQLGPAVDPAELVRLPEPLAELAGGELRTELLGADHFGNLQLAATGEQLAELAGPGEQVRVRIGERSLAARAGRTFADVRPGEILVLRDSAGYAAIAVNGGSALTLLDGPARSGVPVTISGSADPPR